LQRYHFLQQILEEETLLIFNSPNFLYVLPHIQQLQGDGVATRMLFNLGKDLLEGTLNAIYFGLQRAWFALFDTRANRLNAAPSKSSRKPIAVPIATPSKSRTPLIHTSTTLGIPHLSHPQRRLVLGPVRNGDRDGSATG
jgi:hypothetical protein